MGHHGPLLGHLGPSWAHLSLSWAHLGAVLGSVWAIMGPCWAILGHLGPILAHLGLILAEIAEVDEDKKHLARSGPKKLMGGRRSSPQGFESAAQTLEVWGTACQIALLKSTVV